MCFNNHYNDTDLETESNYGNYNFCLLMFSDYIMTIKLKHESYINTLNYISYSNDYYNNFYINSEGIDRNLHVKCYNIEAGKIHDDYDFYVDKLTNFSFTDIYELYYNNNFNLIELCIDKES